MIYYLNPGITNIDTFIFFHDFNCNFEWVYESVSDWGDCDWVFRVFQGISGDLRLVTGCFMGFLGWICECGATAR